MLCLHVGSGRKREEVYLVRLDKGNLITARLFIYGTNYLNSPPDLNEFLKNLETFNLVKI